MANKFWVGDAVGGDNWSNANAWSSSSGGAGGAGSPTATDPAYFDSLSIRNCTIDTTASCKELSAGDYTRTLTFNAALSIYGDFTLGPAMTVIHNSQTISLESLLGFGRDIDTNAKQLGTLNINAKASMGANNILSALHVTGDLLVDASTSDSTGKDILVGGDLTVGSNGDLTVISAPNFRVSGTATITGYGSYIESTALYLGGDLYIAQSGGLDLSDSYIKYINTKDISYAEEAVRNSSLSTNLVSSGTGYKRLNIDYVGELTVKDITYAEEALRNLSPGKDHVESGIGFKVLNVGYVGESAPVTELLTGDVAYTLTTTPFVWVKNYESNTLTDATTAVLSDPSGLYGIKVSGANTATVAAGTAGTKVSTGYYKYITSALNSNQYYVGYWKITRTDGSVSYSAFDIPIAGSAFPTEDSCIVTGKCVDGAGNPLSAVKVMAAVIGSHVYYTDPSGSKISIASNTFRTTTNTSGVWSLTLARSSTLTLDSTTDTVQYQITLKGKGLDESKDVIVPDAATARYENL